MINRKHSSLLLAGVIDEASQCENAAYDIRGILLSVLILGNGAGKFAVVVVNALGVYLARMGCCLSNTNRTRSFCNVVLATAVTPRVAHT